MKGKTTRSRLVGAFGAAGGTLVLSPILGMFIGLEWSLWLLATFEAVGAFLVIAAVALHMYK
jgi:hypothetical protein